MTEEWLPAPGYDGFYEVSSLGRVRSLSRIVRSSFGAERQHRGRVMSPPLERHGYRRIIFRVNGKLQTFSVHRLVCEAFHGEKRNALHNEVDHIDGDRENNAAANLRWVSHGENIHHRRPGESYRGENNGFSKLTEASVCQIKNLPRRQTAKAIAEQYGVSIATIYDIWNGRSWKHVSDPAFMLRTEPASRLRRSGFNQG